MVLYVLGKSHLIHSSHNYSQEEVSKGPPLPLLSPSPAPHPLLHSTLPQLYPTHTACPTRLPFPSPSCPTGLQDYLLCWEMAVAAVAHTYVFSYTDFQQHFDGLSDHVKRSHIRAAMHDMIVQHDFAQVPAPHLPTLI